MGGEGSDELFVGYEHWRLTRDFERRFAGRPALANFSHKLHRMFLGNRGKLYLPMYEKVVEEQPVFWSGTELRSENEKRSILNAEFLNANHFRSSFATVSELYEEYRQSGSSDEYNWMSAADIQFRLPDLLLARLDRMMMAASVEGRNPFLDVNVMEFATRIPPAMKTRKGVEKYILKKAFEGIVPHEILYRKKDSFTVPMNELFRDVKYREMSYEAIRSFHNRTKIFSNEFIQGLPQTQNRWDYWNLTNLAFWYEQIHKQ